MLTVGEILKKEREKKGLFLSEIEKEIKIREKFLQAVENNDWRLFSSRIYIAGIVKNYSKFLGIDPVKSMAFFYRDYEKKEEIKFKRKLSDKYLTPETKKTFITLIFAVVGLFALYFGYQLKLYLTPPEVTIISPTANVFRKEKAVKLVGRTDKEAVVTIAGERVYQNKDGIFEFVYPLKAGKNLVTVEVTGANGKKTVLNKEFFKQEKTAN